MTDSCDVSVPFRGAGITEMLYRSSFLSTSNRCELPSSIVFVAVSWVRLVRSLQCTYETYCFRNMITVYRQDRCCITVSDVRVLQAQNIPEPSWDHTATLIPPRSAWSWRLFSRVLSCESILWVDIWRKTPEIKTPVHSYLLPDFYSGIRPKQKSLSIRRPANALEEETTSIASAMGPHHVDLTNPWCPSRVRSWVSHVPKFW